MKKERLFYLDFIRAFATVVIVLTHYNALYVYNVYAPEKAVISLFVSNIYIGDFGVSLFLIVSGASLMYVYDGELDVKTFFKKRFLNIYPMFWIAYTIAFLYNCYKNGGMPQGIPKVNMLFSVLGLDQWLANFGVQTFSLVAEWFLGLIIIIYLVFPLLQWAIRKHPRILAAAALVMYVISLLTVNKSVTLFARLPEFLFGMYFVKYIKKADIRMAAPALVILIANAIAKPAFPNTIQTTYVGICAFLVLAWLGDLIRVNAIRSVCREIGKYSYACFIIHHMVIYKVIENIDLGAVGRGQSYLLFGWVCVMVALATWILYHLHDKVMKTLREPYA